VLIAIGKIIPIKAFFTRRRLKINHFFPFTTLKQFFSRIIFFWAKWPLEKPVLAYPVRISVN
jgi:hypothetical protein